MPPPCEEYFEKIAQVAESHYQDAIDIIDNKASHYLEHGDKKLRFLDIGSGSNSLLLAGLLKYLTSHREDKQYALSTNVNEIDIYFLDKVNFTESGIGIRPFVELLRDENSPSEMIEDLEKIKLEQISDILRSYSLPELSEYFKKFDYITFKARFIEEDFNREMGTAQEAGTTGKRLLGEEKFDIILLNFAIHEILASSALFVGDESLSPKLFFEKLFNRIYELLDENGIVFLGDAYFPPYVSSAFSNKVLKYLSDTLKHADAPIVFQHPEAILNVVFEKFKDKFELIDDKQFLIVINTKDEGAKGIEKLFRKSYFICLKKKNNG